MYVGLEESRNQGTDKIPRKAFTELNIGDHITSITEITQIKYDEKNNPPQWVLYYLFDSTFTIRVFWKPSQLQVGDAVLVELDVSQGKEYNDRPQFAYKVHNMEKIERTDERFIKYLHKFQYREIIRKVELKKLPDGSRVKLFTKVLNLFPNNGIKEKYQKILIADADNKPINLWFQKENFQIFEYLTRGEYFILKATVKTTEINEKARYLSFESLITAKDAYSDPIVKSFFGDRIKNHSHKLLYYLDSWKSHIAEPNENIDLLLLMLRSFCVDMYPEDIPPANPSKKSDTN
ncbi:MAG TPA: hypothetical protein VMV49_16370 [Candidatus Deferrimicrobium sp.]|nr:hypothetical protein [Candidatus Deferrimicrobium sp.]